MNIAATSRLASLLGSASFFTIANALAAHAQQVAQAPTAQATQEELPENVLITGSLIRGTVAVGVPVVNLGPQDFAKTGAVSASDLFKSIPQFNVGAAPGAGTIAAGRAEGGTRVNLRQLDTGTAPRNLMMIDGLRYPPQDQGLCQIEPDILPVVAIERIDLLLDGASATYGSDALGGVFNIILRRAYDGAITQLGYKAGAGGNTQFYASQLWGRTWDGGNITLSWEWRSQEPIQGNISSRYGFDFSPWGLDDRTPLASSIPGTISTGALAAPDNTNYPAANGHNCTNCYAIPQGTGANFNEAASPTNRTPTLRWNGTSFVALNGAGTAGTGPVNGTANEFNPYDIVDYSAGLQFTGGAVTIDQQLTKDISFYGEGFYGMRRARVLQQANANQLGSFQVPTWNPYYPTGISPTGATLGTCTTNPSTAVPAGVPAGCVPNNLRLNYHLSVEMPSIQSGGELAQRYQMGLNVALPAEWAAQISYSMTRDSNWVNTAYSANKAAVSAALGWTIQPSAAIGTAPSFGAWTKPGFVPYLNLFCDPHAFQCNSPDTVAYIGNYNRSDEAYWLNEKSVKADGPLFDLPGGTVKAAIGAAYFSNKYIIEQQSQNPNNTVIQLGQDPQGRNLWAVYAQLNVPVFSDQNAIFGFRRLDFELSWRHDQYSDFGGTSNQKIGFNWSPIVDWTIRGGYGTSFRAPNFGENSLLVNAAWNGFGLPPTIFNNNASILITCTGGRPEAGSGSEKLFNAGFGCGSPPGGMSFNGGAKSPNVAGWRDYFNSDGQTLKPEQSLNWAATLDYAPTNNFLAGLNVTATWYSIKITSVLVGFGNPTTTTFNDGSRGFSYIVPSDLRDPGVGQRGHIDGFSAGDQLCPGMDLTPTACAPFEAMVATAFALPNNTVPPTALTLIYWLNDGGTFNKGWQKNEGVDYSISYDWDMGDWGAFNVAHAGTYYTHVYVVRIPGAAGAAGEVEDFYHTDGAPLNGLEQNGILQGPPNSPRPRFRSRSTLGWTKGQWDATLFMNYDGHFFHTQTSPPNVNNGCLISGGTIGGGAQPCAIQGYTNLQPSYYTFDLSVGYDTGEDPANDYLRNIGIQFTVDNIMDREPAFEYRISTGGGNPSTFDILKNLYGRVIGVRLTKTW